MKKKGSPNVMAGEERWLVREDGWCTFCFGPWSLVFAGVRGLPWVCTCKRASIEGCG